MDSSPSGGVRAISVAPILEDSLAPRRDGSSWSDGGSEDLVYKLGLALGSVPCP